MRRKNINKLAKNNSKTPGERLLLDISVIKKISLGKKNIWTLIEYQFSKMNWSIFTQRRGDMSNKVVEFIKKLKAKDPKMVTFLRMDNANENYALKSKIENEGLNVQMEFTSPNTPQQNGQVERSFATLWGCMRAMLNNSGVNEEMRNELWVHPQPQNSAI
jgi:hypothetical protein